MHTRRLGKTGRTVGEIGFGAWAIGGSWGEVPEDQAMDALRAAQAEGTTFFDTADVYGMGRSERLIARLRAEATPSQLEAMTVATKAGRRLDPHVADDYDYEHLSRFVDDSRTNLAMDTLDLLQLHCPPTDVYRRDDAFDALERLQREGRIRHAGVSVETVEEARLAIDHPVVSTIQIIFNPFRLKPRDEVFPLALARDVGIVVRVPLASGLLTGKFDRHTTFASDDHRTFNRYGASFDVGETFSGVDLESGLDAVEELRTVVPEGATLAQATLRWILMHPAVSTVIPGAKRPEQARENARASDLPPLDLEAMRYVDHVYDRWIRASVHERW